MKPSNAEPLTRRHSGGLGHWNPREEMANVRRDVDDLIRRTFPFAPLPRPASPDGASFDPALDVYETDDQIILFAAVPGYKPDEIMVQASADTVTLCGDHKTLFGDEKAIPHRSSGLTESARFRVTYSLPAEINPDKVQATFADGILRLEMPKSEQARVKMVKVPITAE